MTQEQGKIHFNLKLKGRITKKIISFDADGETISHLYGTFRPKTKINIERRKKINRLIRNIDPSYVVLLCNRNF